MTRDHQHNRRYWLRGIVYGAAGWTLADLAAIAVSSCPWLFVPMVVLVYSFFLVGIAAVLWPEICRIGGFLSKVKSP
jgi:fatty acid desaturase